METAITVSFIAGVFSLLGGIVLVLIKKAFDFMSLNKTLAKIELSIDNIEKSLTEHHSNVILFNEVEKAKNEAMVEKVKKMGENLEQIKNNIK